MYAGLFDIAWAETTKEAPDGHIDTRRWELLAHLHWLGWEPDKLASEPDRTWMYPGAFGGEGYRPKDDDVAELGPYPPMVYLGKRLVYVTSCGNWQGCPEHELIVHEFKLDAPNVFGRLKRAISDAAGAAAAACGTVHRNCLEGGDCAARVRAWIDKHAPLPLEPWTSKIFQARFVLRLRPRHRPAPDGQERDNTPASPGENSA